MARIGAEYVECNQSFCVGEVDTSVGISTGDIDRLTGTHLFIDYISFGAFHHHHSITGLAVIYFRYVQDCMKVTICHVIFITYFSWIDNAGSEGQITLFFRDAEVIEIVEKGIAVFFQFLSGIFIQIHIFHVGISSFQCRLTISQTGDGIKRYGFIYI